MNRPLAIRQRLALRDFQLLASARARMELDIEANFKQRTQQIEVELQNSKQRSESTMREVQQQTDRELAENRDELQTRYDDKKRAIETDLAKAKQSAVRHYIQTKRQAEAEFKETRWTVGTLYESERKVAKDQIQHSQVNLRKSIDLLKANHARSLELVKSWGLDNFAPVTIEPAPTSSDAWLALAEITQESKEALAELSQLRLPAITRGIGPYLLVALVWVVLSLPAFLSAQWYWWVLGSTIAVWPIGLIVMAILKNSSRRGVAVLATRCENCVAKGRDLRTSCLEQAREIYRRTRTESKERNQRALHDAGKSVRSRLQTARRDRNEALRRAKKTHEPALDSLATNLHSDIEILEETARKRKLAAFEQNETDTRLAQDNFRRVRDENNRRHASEFAKLMAEWKEGSDRFSSEVQNTARECRKWFAPWEEMGPELKLPSSIPPTLQFGQLGIRLENIPNGVPKDDLLPRPNLDRVGFPALLGFPEQASLLFKTYDDGRQAGIRAVEALLLRAFTSLPAGKARCTIIDPAGRGENFSAFMHLEDYDETLVGSRIWTESAHIEQRLADLTTHMENVLQKYLRNQFHSLPEYNEQAGEVAEPFRFLVVAHFPINFTTDAARRLLSLASAGARCGIYTFIVADTKQTLPQDIDLHDFEDACATLNWAKDHFIWLDDDYQRYPLTLDQPPEPQRCTQLLQVVGEEAKRAGNVEVPFQLIVPPKEEWWTGTSAGELKVPLGRAGATGRQWLTLGQGTSQHALIAGKTGSGKSTLLHVLITQLALRYSPDEVELFLVDFKKGVEFKAYAALALAHARVVAVESEREFGVSVLQRLDAELVRRGDLFRSLGISDLSGYRDRQLASRNGATLAALPRLVLIVDEFQEFFVEDDRLSQESALLLDRLVRQGRAFGVHVLLGTQTLGGAYSLARSTIDQMAVRIALQCSEADAHLILSKDNSEARLLSRPGEAIYNAANGLYEGNHFFQIVWLEDSLRDDYLHQLQAFATERRYEPRVGQVVFEGNVDADPTRNPLLTKLLESREPLADKAPLTAWLGEPVAIKDPTAAIFRRQSASNLLLVGQHESSAFSMMASALISLSAQLPANQQCLSLIIAAALDENSEKVRAELAGSIGAQEVISRDLPSQLEKLHGLVEKRLKGEDDGPAKFLFIYGLQRLRDLRRPDDDFGLSRREAEKPSPFKHLLHILREGPVVGVFTVLWCDSLTNVQRSLDRSALREIEMRVLMQMSPGDSSSLIDSPAASKLGMHRALFYTEEQGKLEKFRPYGLPSAEWLKKDECNHVE